MNPGRNCSSPIFNYGSQHNLSQSSQVFECDGDTVDDFLIRHGISSVLKNKPYVNQLWLQLREENSAFLSHFETLLLDIAKEIQTSQMERANLENALKAQKRRLDEQDRHYEEAEQDLEARVEELQRIVKLNEEKFKRHLQQDTLQNGEILDEFVAKQREEHENLLGRLTQYQSEMKSLRQDLRTLRDHFEKLEDSRHEHIVPDRSNDNLISKHNIEHLYSVVRDLITQEGEKVSQRESLSSLHDFSGPSLKRGSQSTLYHTPRTSLAVQTDSGKEYDGNCKTSDNEISPSATAVDKCIEEVDHEEIVISTEPLSTGFNSLKSRGSPIGRSEESVHDCQVTATQRTDYFWNYSVPPKNSVRTPTVAHSKVNNSVQVSRHNDSLIAKSSDFFPEPLRYFRVALIGPCGVGKTLFQHRASDPLSATLRTESTIQPDFRSVKLMVNGRPVGLHLIDTAGQERFSKLTSSLFRRAECVMLMYDVTDAHSFKKLRYWLDLVNANCDDDILLVIAGNKIDRIQDDPSCRRVAFSQGATLAQSIGGLFFETSSKCNINVETIIQQIATWLAEKCVEEYKRGNVIRLSNLQQCKRQTSCLC